MDIWWNNLNNPMFLMDVWWNNRRFLCKDLESSTYLLETAIYTLMFQVPGSLNTVWMFIFPRTEVGSMENPQDVLSLQCHFKWIHDSGK